jgi:hypothetical protein
MRAGSSSRVLAVGVRWSEPQIGSHRQGNGFTQTWPASASASAAEAGSAASRRDFSDDDFIRIHEQVLTREYECGRYASDEAECVGHVWK